MRKCHNKYDRKFTFYKQYSYKDSYNLTQINSNTIPKIKIKLQNTEWQNINIENLVSVSSKNRLLKPWEIETRNVTVTQNNNTFDVTQKDLLKRMSL